MKYKLVKLTPKHDQLVINLVKSTMGKEVGEHCVEAFADVSGCDKRSLWGAFNEGYELVGCCGIYDGFYDKKKCYISWFSVDEKLQRSGLGTQMMDHITKLALDEGFNWMYVETYDNEQFRKANNFYRKCGFSNAGSILGYLEDGSDAMYYRKRIRDV